MDSYQISVVFILDAESIDDALDKTRMDFKAEGAEKVSVSIEKLEAE